MAKVIGPLHSTEARGRVDSLVYGTWRGIRFTRNWINPVFKSPDCRIAQKARVAAANAAWMLLSNDQHRAWHAYAQAHPRLDWSGVLIRISGYNAFVSCYTICLRAGGTPLDYPPSGAPPLPLSTLSSIQSDNDIDVSWTYPTQPTGHIYKVQLLRTGPISLGKQPDKHHASILTHELLNSSPYEDPQTENGRYGYWGRVIDADTGETTPFLSCSTDFVFSAFAPLPHEGPLSPGTVEDRLGIGTYAWSDPSNAKTSNNLYAHTGLITAGNISHYLYAHNFGVSDAVSDDASIDGIVVEIERYQSGLGIYDWLSPILVDHTGAITGDSIPDLSPWPGSDPNTYITYGASDYYWGLYGLSGANIKDPKFGVVLAAKQLVTNISNAQVDHIRMTFYYTNP